MVAHRNTVITENVDLLGSVTSLTDDVLGLCDHVCPALLNLLVQEFADLRIFEIFRVRINRVHCRVPLLVCTVLLQCIETSRSLLGRFRNRLLEVTAGRRYRSDKCDSTSLSVVQHDHS